MTLVAYVFSNLQTVKDMVRQMPKLSCVIALFYGQDSERTETVMKSS